MKKSCVILDDWDYFIVLLLKIINVFLWERFVDDLLFGDVG